MGVINSLINFTNTIFKRDLDNEFIDLDDEISKESIDISIKRNKKKFSKLQKKAVDLSKHINIDDIKEVNILNHLPIKVIIDGTLYRLNIIKDEKSYITYKSILKDENESIIISVMYKDDPTEAINYIKDELSRYNAVKVNV